MVILIRFGLVVLLVKRDLWEFLAIPPPDNEFIGSESGECIVCATGHTMWDDLLRAGFNTQSREQDKGIITVNRALQDLPCHIDHAWSNHTNKLYWWRVGRDEVHDNIEKHHRKKVVLHSQKEHKGVVVWPFGMAGTSTLSAVYLAFALGYEKVHLCGTPMDNGPHYYEPPWWKTNFDNGKKSLGHARYWANAERRFFKGRVVYYSENLKERMDACDR